MPTLTWIGKEAVENHHKEIPYRLLHCDESLSVGEPGTGNLFGEGSLQNSSLIPPCQERNLRHLCRKLPRQTGKCVRCFGI